MVERRKVPSTFFSFWCFNKRSFVGRDEFWGTIHSIKISESLDLKLNKSVRSNRKGSNKTVHLSGVDRFSRLDLSDRKLAFPN